MPPTVTTGRRTSRGLAWVADKANGSGRRSTKTQDWAEVTILELRPTEALVNEVGTQRVEWVPLSRVFDHH